MVENNIKIINDLKKEIEKVKLGNNKIRLNIQKKLLFLQQLEIAINEQDE